MADVPHTLTGLFLSTCERYPERQALAFPGHSLSYAQLRELACRCAAAIGKRTDQEQVAILTGKSLSAYMGILGTLLAGKAYVPLNPSFPEKRLDRMLQQSECDLMITDEDNKGLAQTLLSGLKGAFSLLFPEQLSESAEVSGQEIGGAENGDDWAYQMFTTGSTGTPKMVPVRHSSATAYVRNILDLYDLRPEDRFSHTFDLTFDLSVHDLFVCWAIGACLCVPGSDSPYKTAAYIREQQPTVWFSVPSRAIMLDRMKLLKKEAFPFLRFSFFCGEPLTTKTAKAWKNAAPASRSVNLYGPTESTIAITHYEVDKDVLLEKKNKEVLPIGHVFSGHEARVLNPQGEPVPYGAKGELCLRGPQVFEGYANVKDNSRYFWSDNEEGMKWYRTGDLVRESPEGLLFIGRIDQEVKIRGYRVSLAEVEEVLRHVARTEMVAVIARYSEQEEVNRLMGFVTLSGKERGEADLVKECRKELPAYMIPDRIRVLQEMPLNANGKIDREELARLSRNEDK